MSATTCVPRNAREQRGIELADKVRIQPVGKGVTGKWIVPSSSGTGTYTVDLNSQAHRCTCPDWETRRCKCKHVYAVEYSVRRQRETTVETVTESDGTVTETETVTETLQVTKRKTYRQDWPAYNKAQTGEKAQFQVLLHDLCKHAPVFEQTAGRNRLPLPEMVFAAAFKVYSTVSTRRFMCDLADAKERGYLSKVPHFNSVMNYLEMPEMTAILQALIQRSAQPLKAIEVDFAVDSSGFSGSKFSKWSFVKYNANKMDFAENAERTDWLKLHLMCGVVTNVVSSVEVSGRNANDCPFYPGLVEKTAKTFTIREVSADKAYSSVKNLESTAAAGATAFVPFKSNSTGTGLRPGDDPATGGSDLWLSMWRYYNFHTEKFLTHYHKRSNVESTFSMIKAKFGQGLRSKGQVAQMNEALCKVLCHNICCVIQSIHELGIEADFALQAA